VDFFSLPNPSSRTIAVGSTQPLTQTSTRNLAGSKGRPACKADNLTAICEPTVDVSQPYEPSRPVTGIALLLTRLINRAISTSRVCYG
jgi:hypothetical protein